MILISADSSTRKDQVKGAKEQTGIITRAFYLGDREVSIEQFQRCVDDAEYPAPEKPQNWQGVYQVARETRKTGAHPVQQVSWYDAVLYCNWLSRKHGLTLCYERTGEKEKSSATSEEEFDAWRLVEGAAGYRLPTEAEWEYACRAGTKTKFGHGDEESLLPAYAVYVQSGSQACGGKLPNAWGLFDMHGNLWEWCQDSYSSDLSGEVVDPLGPSSGSRISRGGSWLDSARYCMSGHRPWVRPAYRINYDHRGLMVDQSFISHQGFRVALVASASK
jgi:formylglycine-generating enzyme required for sulfatase activity